MDKVFRDLDIDLGDRKTQVIIAGGVLVGGYLLIRGRGNTSAVSSNDETPASFVVTPTDAFGTRADAQGQPGAWGWVGNSGSTPTTPEPEPEPETPNTPMSMTVSSANVDAGKSVNVNIDGVNMNDRIDVYFNNTSGSSLKQLTGNIMGKASGSITIPATQSVGVVYLVAQNQRTGDVANAAVTVQKAATASPVTPKPETPKPAPVTPKPETPKPAPVTYSPKGVISPATLSPNGKGSLTLSGFAPNEVVSVKAQHWSLAFTIKVNASGNGSASFTVPAHASPGVTALKSTGSISKKVIDTTFTITATASNNKTKYGRVKITNPESKGYSCPAYSTMVQEPGSSNHVCERNDDGRLFPVTMKGRGGDAGSVRMIGLPKSGFGTQPEPVLLNQFESIHDGESLRDFAVRVYGTEAGVRLLEQYNDLDTDTLQSGAQLKVR